CARGGYERFAAGVAGADALCARRASGSALTIEAGARNSAVDASHRSGAPRLAGIVVPGNRRSAAASRRNGEVAHQPGTPGTGAPVEAHAGQATDRASPPGCVSPVTTTVVTVQ